MALHSVDATATVERDAEIRESPREPACPRCAEAASGPGPLRSTLLPGADLRRCSRCGARFAAPGGAERAVLTCGTCELPYLADDADTRGSCPDCLSGRVPDDLPHLALAAATQDELVSALEARWRFFTSEASATYLESLVQRVAGQVEGAPRDCRVVLFEDSALKTLALPSGLILLSQETLNDIEDEAQLAFLLAHELVHASRDAEARLVRIVLRSVARGEPAGNEERWAEVAEDIVRLGYGRRREREADARALEAVLALGYDPSSVIRYFRHLERLGGRSDDRVRELLLAHPPAGERIRRAEALLSGGADAGSARLVNREVLRRAARSHARGATRTLLGGPPDALEERERPSPRRPLVPLLAWVGTAAALLAALAALLTFIFRY